MFSVFERFEDLCSKQCRLVCVIVQGSMEEGLDEKLLTVWCVRVRNEYEWHEVVVGRTKVFCDVFIETGTVCGFRNLSSGLCIVQVV